MDEQMQQEFLDRARNGESLGTTLGFEYREAGPDTVVIEVPVTAKLHQPVGIVHGGVYAAIAEEVASVAGQAWLGDRGNVVGVNNNTDFLRSISEGTLTAVGTPIHRGRSQQLWRVEITDASGRVLATSQVRLANLSPKA